MATKGVLFKLQSVEKRSAVDVINAHLKKARENGGEVYFSTNIQISPRQGDITSILLCFEKNPGAYGYVQADVLDILRGNKNTFIPDNASELSPEEYADQPKSTWLRLKNFRRADPQYLAGLSAIKSNGELARLTDIFFESPRLNRIYWFDGTDDNDGLIF